MTRKQQILLFILVALACIIAILTLPAPYRNFIPVVWGLTGFTINAALSGWFQYKINKRLVNDYADLLKQLHIGTHYIYWDVRMKKKILRIDAYHLWTNKSLPALVDEKTRKWIQQYKLSGTLTIIAFILFPLIAFLLYFKM